MLIYNFAKIYKNVFNMDEAANYKVIVVYFFRQR